jgi:hypothetical protein
MKHERSAYGAPQGDGNDCTVRALAVVLALPYSECHVLYAANGRKAGRNVPVAVCVSLLPALGLRRLDSTVRGMTLARFVAEYPRGRYVVHKAGHALAVVDGVVHDWKAQPRARVKRAWQVPTQNLV